MVSLGTVEIGIKLDTRNLDSGVKSLEKRLDKVSLVPSVNTKQLHDLNKLLDVKQRHWLETVKLFDNNPIRVKVDGAEVTKAQADIDSLSGKLSDMSATVKAEVTHKFEGQVSRDSQIIAELRRNNSEAVKDNKRESKKEKGILGQVTSGLTNIATSPVKNIVRGFQEGMGQDIAKDFSKGVKSQIEVIIEGRFGSTELIGKTVADKFAKNIASSVGIIASKANQYINEELEKEDKAIEKDAGGMVPSELMEKYKEAKISPKYKAFKFIQETASQATQLGANFVPVEQLQDEQNISALKAEKQQRAKKSQSAKGVFAVARKTQNIADLAKSLSEVDSTYAGVLEKLRKESAELNAGILQLESEAFDEQQKLQNAIKQGDKSSVEKSQSIILQKSKQADSFVARILEIQKTAAKLVNDKELAIVDAVQKSGLDQSGVEKAEVVRLANFKIAEINRDIDTLSNFLEDLESTKTKVIIAGMAKGINASTKSELQTILLGLDQESIGAEKKILSLKQEKASEKEKIKPLESAIASVVAQQKRQDIPDAFNAVIDAVTGGKGIDPTLMPKIVADDKAIKKMGDFDAVYDATKNQMIFSSALMKRLKENNLTLQDVMMMIHEFQHAYDFDFGSAEGLQAYRQGVTLRSPVKPSTPEDNKLVDAHLLRYAPKDRRIEASAYSSQYNNIAPVINSIESRKNNEKIFGIGGDAGSNIMKSKAWISVKANTLKAAKEEVMSYGDLPVVNEIVSGIDAAIKLSESLDSGFDSIYQKIAQSGGKDSKYLALVAELIERQFAEYDKFMQGVPALFEVSIAKLVEADIDPAKYDSPFDWNKKPIDPRVKDARVKASSQQKQLDLLDSVLQSQPTAMVKKNPTLIDRLTPKQSMVIDDPWADESNMIGAGGGDVVPFNQSFADSSKRLNKSKAESIEYEVISVVSDLKGQLKGLVDTRKAVSESIKKLAVKGEQGVPKEELAAYEKSIDLALDRQAVLDERIADISDEIVNRIKSFGQFTKSKDDIEQLLDDALNLNDFKKLREARVKIGQQIKAIRGSGDLDKNTKDVLVGNFKELAAKSKVDVLTTDIGMSDFVASPIEATLMTIDKGSAQLADKGVELVHAFVDPIIEAVDNVKYMAGQVVSNPIGALGAAGSTIVKAGNQGVRAIAPAIGGAYSVASGIENAALSVLPYGHLAKKGLQVGAVTMGLPMAAATIPALAPVAGMLGMAGHMGGAAAGGLAASQMAGISSIPIVGGQVAAMLGGAASGLGTIVAEMGAAAIAVNAVSVGTKALIGTALEPQTKEKLSALQPANAEIKKATTKKTSKLIEKAQNLDLYLPTLPENQRKLVGEYLPKVAALEQANQGDFIPKGVDVPGLKALAPADYKQLDPVMKSAVKDDWVTQYKAAQKNLFEFAAKVRGSIDPLDRMKGDIASLSSAFKAQVKRMEKQGKNLGIDVSKYKMDESAFKGVTLDADAVAMPDVSKLKRDAVESGKDIGKGFAVGAKSTSGQVDLAFVELAQSGQESFDKEMGIQSPSKWAIERMNFIALGMMVGATNNLPKVKGVGEMTAQEYAKAFKKVIMPDVPTVVFDTKRIPNKQFKQIADPWDIPKYDVNKLPAIPPLNKSRPETKEQEANRIIDEQIKKTNELTAAIERKQKAQERVNKLPVLPPIDSERQKHFGKFKTDPYVHLDNNQPTGNREIDALINRIRQKGIVVDQAISDMVKEAQSSIDSAFDGVASTSNAESKKLIEKVTKTLSSVSIALDNYNFDDGKFVEGSQKSLEQLIDIYSIGDSSSNVSLEDIQSLVKRLTQTLAKQPSTGNYLTDMENQLDDLAEAYSIDPNVVAPDSKEVGSILGQLKQKEAELNKAMDLVDQREELVASGYSINDANRIIASAEDGNGGSPPVPPIFDLIKEKIPIIGQAVDRFDALKDTVKNFGMMAAGGIGLALLGKGLYEVGKNALTAYQNLEGVFIASKLLAGSDKYIANLRKQALQLGSDLRSTLEQGIQFSSALVGTPLEAMSQQMFQDFSTSLSYLGLQQQQYDSALLALKQVASKGRVSLEEITGQLGESVPGIMPLVADALGTNVQGAIQQIESGNVLAEDLLPKLAAGMKNRTAGLAPIYERSLTASTGRLGTSLESLNVGIGEKLAPAVIPAINTISTGIIGLSENVDKLMNAVKFLAIGLSSNLVVSLVSVAMKAITLNGVLTVTEGIFRGLTLLTKNLYLVAKPLLIALAAFASFEALNFAINFKGDQQILDATKSIDNLINKIKELKKEQEDPNDKKAGIKSDNWMLGALDFVNVSKFFGGTTYGDLEFDRNLKAVQEFSFKANEAMSGIGSVLDTSSLNNYADELSILDNQVANLQGKMTALRLVDAKKNSDEISELGDQIKTLDEKRVKLSQSFFPLGADGLSQAIDNLKLMIQLTESLRDSAKKSGDTDRYNEATQELSVLNNQLKVAEKAAKAFDDSMKSLGNTLNAQRTAFIDLSASIAQATVNLNDSLNIERTALTNAQISRGLATQIDQFEDLGFSVREAEKRVQSLQKIMADQKAYIASDVIDTKIKSTIEVAAGKSINDLNAGDIKRLELLAENDTQGSLKAVFSQVSGVLNDIIQTKSQILEANKGLSEARKAVIEFQRTEEDYFRNVARTVEDFNFEIESQQLSLGQQVEQQRRSLEDAAIGAMRENRDLAESYSDLMFDLELQLKNAQSELADTQDKIRATKFKRDLLDIAPGVDNPGRQFAQIFATLFDSLSGSVSESRKLEIQQEQIQQDYITTLRRIRSEQERQLDAERNRTRQMVDLVNASVNLINTIRRSVIEFQRRVQDFQIDYGRQTGRTDYPFNGQLTTPQVPTRAIAPGVAPAILAPSPQAPKAPPTTMEELKERYGPQSSKGQDTLALNFPVNGGEIAQTAQLGGWIENQLNRFGNWFEGTQNKEPKTLLELARFYTRQNQQFLDGLDPVLVSRKLAIGTFENKSMQSAFNNLARSKGFPQPLVPPVVPPAISNPNSLEFKQRQATPPSNRTRQQQAPPRNPANIAVPMSQRVNLARNFMQMYTDALGSNIGKAELAKLAKDLAEYRSKDAQLQQQFERYVGRTPDERMVDIANFQKAKQQRRVANSRTEQSKAGMQEGNSTRPLGTQAVLGGEYKYWAGEQYGWQSEGSFRKLLNNNFQQTQQTPPPTIKAQATIAQGSSLATQAGNVMPQAMGGDQWEQIGVARPYPIDDFAPATNLAGDIRDTKLENLAASQELNGENIALASSQAKFDIERWKTDLQRTRLEIQRGLQDSKISVDQLIMSSKGYLSAWDEIKRAGQEVEQQYRSQRRSLEDQIFTLDQSIKGQDEIVKRTRQELETSKEQLANAKSLSDVERQRMEESIALQQKLFDEGQAILETNKKQAEEAISQYQADLNRLNATEKIATANAQALKDQELSLAALKSYADMAGNLSAARYNLGGTLINEAPVLKAKVEMITAPIEAANQARSMKLPAEETASFVAMAQETANLNLKQSYVEAIPFLKEFSSGLKDVVLQTETWQQALKKLFDLVASTILDQMVIKPIISTLSQWIAPMVGLGQQIGLGGQPQAQGGNNLSPFAAIGNLAGNLLGSFTGGTIPLPAFYKGGMVDDQIQNLAKGGVAGDPLREIGRNAIVALNREKALGGGKPVLAALTKGEVVVPRNKVPQYMAFERSVQLNGLMSEAKQISNYAMGGVVGRVTPINNNQQYGGQSTVVNNVTNVSVKDTNAMGYTAAQIERRNQIQAERAKRLG